MSTSIHTATSKALNSSEGTDFAGPYELSARLILDSDLDWNETTAVPRLDLGDDFELRVLPRRSDSPSGKQDYANSEGESVENEATETFSHGQRDSVASFELYTPEEGRRVRRKLDTHLVLFVALLYLLSFLDRSNIGNAKVAGLTTDLHLSDNDFEWLLTSFYIAYILFQWMTLCYTVFPPHAYISCCVCSWGLLASLQSIISSWSGLLVLRVCLGIGEAAFVGIPIYLSFFFRREELALRVGLFIAAAPLATTFASTLAWAIATLGNNTGIASWRLLFLIEGFPAIFVAVWAWWWLPDSPSTVRWFTQRERKVATLRMRNETKTDQTSVAEKFTLEQSNSRLARQKYGFDWCEVFKTLRDPKCYLTAGMLFCCNVAFSSMPVFLPTIVNGMGYSRLASQGLSAPPFLFAFLAVILTAYISDRKESRSVPMMFHAALAFFGYMLATVAGILQTGSTIRYLASFLICSGFFSAVTIIITWTINNQTSDEGKGTGMAVLNVIGQMGPLLGTRLYPDDDAPYFVRGMGVCAGAMALVFVLALVLRLVLKRENARKRVRPKAQEGKALFATSSGDGFQYLT